MNIEIDTENKTITLKEDVPLKDIVELSKALKDWEEYDIVVVEDELYIPPYIPYTPVIPYPPYYPSTPYSYPYDTWVQCDSGTVDLNPQDTLTTYN
jgi:hypothetical protein